MKSLGGKILFVTNIIEYLDTIKVNLKVKKIEYTGFSAENINDKNINDTLGSIELRTLLFKLWCM